MVRKARCKISIPKNLLIRASTPMIGGHPPTGFEHTSAAAPKVDKAAWAQRVETNALERWHCPASLQGKQCGPCRACWDPDIKHIIYPDLTRVIPGDTKASVEHLTFNPLLLSEIVAARNGGPLPGVRLTAPNGTENTYVAELRGSQAKIVIMPMRV